MESRDYNKIIDRINKIKNNCLEIREIGKTDYGSIMSLTLKSTSKNPIKILICAGIHGDEIAGIEAAIRFAEKNNSNFLNNFEFTIIPCINPYGYIHDVRWNTEGIDINRTFENNLSMESLMIKHFLKKKKFDIFIDFHEDYEYREFYLFEIACEDKKIGNKIIEKIKSIGEINTNEIIDGFISKDGVIDIDCEEFCTNVLALYIAEHHSKHCITLETPMQWDFEDRVKAHLDALDVVLNNSD